MSIVVWLFLDYGFSGSLWSALKKNNIHHINGNNWMSIIGFIFCLFFDIQGPSNRNIVRRLTSNNNEQYMLTNFAYNVHLYVTAICFPCI